MNNIILTMGWNAVIVILMILSWQSATFSYNIAQTVYKPSYSYPHPYSQLSSRTGAVPIINRGGPSQNLREAALQISNGSELFSFEMVHTISSALRQYDTNFIISPFSIWSLMVLLAEGAADQSFLQMEKTLHLPKELNYLRTAYRTFQDLLVVNTSTVELAVNQALFSDLNRPINVGYANILRNDYEADHIPVNFIDKNIAAKTINDHIKFRTRGKIQDIIKPDDLTDAQLLLTSTIFFRGQWTSPFNISETREEPFYRENGDFAGNVSMMYQRNVFPYAIIPELGARVVELPYGKENRLCMLLILPISEISLTTVFENLRKFNIATIANELHKFDNVDDYEEAEIELTLPRFSIDSDLELRTVLEHLGIHDIFDPVKSNLSKLSREPTFVSRVFHKAIIEVNEEGTVAAAVSAGSVSFKQTPIEINLNRPFGFLITERQTHTLLFAGQIKYPKKL